MPHATKTSKTSSTRKPRATRRAKDGSNSLVRLLGVLDLFTPAAPAWSTDALIRSLGMSRSNGYRYIKALSDVGLIAPVSNGHYVLGPRIVELDRQIRQCDPLYNAAGPAMKRLGIGEPALRAALCAIQRLRPVRARRAYAGQPAYPLYSWSDAPFVPGCRVQDHPALSAPVPIAQLVHEARKDHRNVWSGIRLDSFRDTWPRFAALAWSSL